MRKFVFGLVLVSSLSFAKGPVESFLRPGRGGEGDPAHLRFAGCVTMFEAGMNCSFNCRKRIFVLGNEEQNEAHCGYDLYEPIACYCVK